MIDKNYCMSSYLTFRYIVDPNKDFFEGMHHKIKELPDPSTAISIDSSEKLDREIEKIFHSLEGERLGILLSGGMDSACLASYMPKGSNAYTFRFENGKFAADELKRAEKFAEINQLKLHYVDICWADIFSSLPKLMKNKQAPVHSIEPQIYIAALQAKNDGITKLVIGDAADYVFYGMDGLVSRDWKFNEFYDRSTYLHPEEILIDGLDLHSVYEKYRKNKDDIDFIGIYDKIITEESYDSYNNALITADISYIDPYENFKIVGGVDLKRNRSGDSKYFIRELFRRRYKNIEVPEKSPMPRPVDLFFKDWHGPQRSEFRQDIDINKYNGNQKWLMFCLEYFLNIYDQQ